jgi:hypothetical protein
MSTICTYDLERGGLSIRCRLCGRVSHHVGDVDNRYCGHCHLFHEDAQMVLEALQAGELPRRRPRPVREERP